MKLSQIIEIQTQQLKEWERLLKPEAFKELQRIARRDNVGLTDATWHKVIRGDQLYEVLVNVVLRKMP